MSIEWTSDLATGVGAVDDQHRELYRQVDALHAAMKDGALDRVPAVIEYLAGYVSEHFATEERWMEESGYPGLAAHREAHAAFREELRRYAGRAAPGRITVSFTVDLSGWLGAWLRDHVRRIDGEMARHLTGAGAFTVLPRPRR